MATKTQTVELSPTVELSTNQGQKAILHPLVFPEMKRDMSCFYHVDEDLPIPCLVCSQEFNGCNGQQVREDYLHHIASQHKIIVHRTSHIASYKCYFQYWKTRFVNESDLANLLPVIETHPETTTDISEKFYLLSDAISEDKQFREFLQKNKIESLLEIQDSERQDTGFKRSCLFCSEICIGNRTILFDHMIKQHHFNIGLPDNIVFVNEFLDLLQSKLESLQCLYCERTFRDHTTLRDHMRKKQHKRINPKNQIYDKFYMINYLEPGKSWEDILKEDDVTIEFEHDKWSDWIEPSVSLLTCLFCSHTSPSLSELNQHMTETHHFDFVQLTLNVDYYSKIKTVNYIRRQVHNGTCIHCCHGYNDSVAVVVHMEQEGHFMLPTKRSIWDQVQYLFPTYENDNLLCVLEDKEEDPTN